ncbi:hypothetical protein [Candidatus Protochlamydia phocaeensis]|uniref:hypothetical protein n=1 Tax=Candidatus Protochlamydia phocaeensis TaxID=1414722 RepID=UPI0008391AA5|nr:hypothetical protein [Candidatus Protochlamydia phocaeensis]
MSSPSASLTHPLPSNWEPPVQEQKASPPLPSIDFAITALAQTVLPASDIQPESNQPTIRTDRLKQMERSPPLSQNDSKEKPARKLPPRKQRTYFPAGEYYFFLPSQLN